MAKGMSESGVKPKDESIEKISCMFYYWQNLYLKAYSQNVKQ
jgi:hypothetical protein